MARSRFIHSRAHHPHTQIIYMILVSMDSAEFGDQFDAQQSIFKPQSVMWKAIVKFLSCGVSPSQMRQKFDCMPT